MLSTELETLYARPDTYVTLARGCKEDQLRVVQDMCGELSATAPIDEEAHSQVGELLGPDMIEFTSNPAIAERYGANNHVVIVKIQRKYLTKGSVPECGWACRTTAPIEILGSKSVRTT